MKIYLYLNKQIKVFFLPETVSGSFSFDVDEQEVSKLINVDARDDQWHLFETVDCKILDGSQYVKSTPLEPYKFYVITRNNVNYLIYTAPSNENDYKSYCYMKDFDISIGVKDATASYRCPYVKDISLKISTDKNGLILVQALNANVYVNKIIVSNNTCYIKNGDEVSIYGVKILFLNKTVLVFASDNVFSINMQLSKLQVTGLKNYQKEENIDIKDRPLYSEDDYFSKSPRLRRIIEEKKIELSQPPAAAKGGEMPFMLTLGPMLTMAVTSIVMITDTVTKITSGEMDVDKSIGQLVSSGAMLLSSLLWPLLTTFYNKHNEKRNKKKTITAYNKYLKEKEEELKNEVKLQSEIIKENVISLEDCLNNLKHRKLNFWDKRIDQSDFLVARIGVGNEKLKVKIDDPKDGFSVDDDELKKKVKELVEKYKYIENVPIGYSFYENNITAIMGTFEKSHTFMNNVLFQLLTFYSYDELKIVVFTNEKNEQQWDYIKYLNHNMTNDSTFRFFASNEENAKYVVDVLGQELNGRLSSMKDEQKGRLFKPYYFIVIDDLDVIKKNNIVEQISEIKANVGFSVVILESKLSKLPSLCNNFINLGDKTSGVLKNSYEKQEQQLFTDEINPNINMMEVVKVLSNIPIDIVTENGGAGDLPDSITFLEMAKAGKVEQLNILNRWNTNDSTSNLKAEVGVDPDGKLMYLDLHEKAHGPHGLIAGMTGSGKSEFIITWILSLCMNFSPEDVAFILIDYKGGGLAFAFENLTTGVRLPHLTGTITNLDKAEISRTLVSIDSEVKRRQKIFNEARDKLGESTIDIYKYQGFFHEGKLSEPLPHLFIVCDEFAELKAQQPEFMDNLISVARIGRSLGVHLILATQKPSGVVNDQIWSNTKFRVCLKVQDASDSNEMLKRPDAASLKQTGRFYLQVGYDEYFALGQSGWCGAKYYPSDIIQKSVDKSINVVDETGIVMKNIQAGTSKAKKAEAQGEQLAAIMNEIINVAKQSDRFAKRLWLENIPAIITVEDVEKKYNFQYDSTNFQVVIGEYDAPEKQEQLPLIYHFIEDGNANIISTDSSESEEIINTMLYNVLKHFSPKEISFYVIDYGSQGFMKYRKAPHCGGVVSPSDSEEFSNLIKLINEEQRQRKKILAEAGVDYKDYIKSNPGSMPVMIVVLNNYESINESNESFYEMFGEMVRDSERYGIVYIVTCNSLSAVPDRFKQSIPFALPLKLKEITDYGYCFGKTDRKQPKDLFGRGICFNEELHEFQTAFICSERTEENKFVLNLIDELNSKNIEPCVRIPSLPEQVMLDDIKNKLKGINRIPVGIEKGTLVVRTFDLTVDVGKIVLSSKLKYLKYFLKSFIDEVLYLQYNMIVIDPSELMPEISSKVKNYFKDNFDEKLDKIMEFIDNKNEKDDKHNVILVNSIGKLMSKMSDTSKIESLFEKCKTSNNFHILIADENSKVRDLSYESWFASVDVSEGIFIGPGVDDQNILKISNYTRELSMALPKNYGYYIAEGSYHVVKLIEFEKVEESEDDEE